jgi:hypothetical protein
MYAVPQPLLDRDPLQQLEQLPALADAQRGEQVALGVTSEALEPGDQDLPLTGEVQRVNPPVASAAAALHQTALLELVEQPDHPAGRHPELIRDRLLAAARMLCHYPEDTYMCWADPQRGDEFREQRGRVRAHLGEQEARSDQGPLFGHPSIIWFAESFCP